MYLVPLGRRVALKPIATEETTKSGIVLPGQTQEMIQKAKVIAIGSDINKSIISCGITVIYPIHMGIEVELDDEKYIVIKENDILAVVKEG